MVEYDFKFWASLATQDPDTFESLRKKFIEYEISKSDYSKDRLLGLQFQIDMERERSASAMGACIRISAMMMDCLHEKLQPRINEFLYNDKFEADKDTKEIKNNIVSLFEDD